MKIGVKKLRFKSGVKKDLKSQQFQKLNIVDNKIAHSEKWLKINRKYVPKSFIIGAYSPASYSSPTQPHELWFLLITGEEVYCEFARRHRDEFLDAIKIFRKVLPEALITEDWTIFSMVSEKGKRRQIKQKAKELLVTEEDCLSLINHNPVDFLTLLAGEKVNKKDYYKIDDSDLYFQEFGHDSDEDNY